MFRSRRRAIAAISLLSSLVLTAPLGAEARPRPPTELDPRFAAVVMDAGTGQILYAIRPEARRFPASISKLLTFYLTFEQLAAGRLKPTDTLVLSPHAAAQPRTNLGMYAGEKISVQNALLGMATHSANDMAMALAERIGGSQAGFAEMMNRKAQQLGMKNSYFDNPNGLPDSRQVSTAHDLAILCRAIQRDFPQYYGVFGTRSFTFHGRTMVNTNHLLGTVPGVDGMKTGTTNAAGHSIAISGVHSGRRLIVVVLGAPSGPSRDASARNLLSAGFEELARDDHAAVAQGDAEDDAQPPEVRHAGPPIHAVARHARSRPRSHAHRRRHPHARP